MILPGSVIVVRGAGDLATGVIVKLHNCGYKVIALECEKPTAVRRTVSLCEAVYDSEACVEGVRAVLVSSAGEALARAGEGCVPILVDPECESLAEIQPAALLDAILAKRNLGTNRSMAQRTIALGPGFYAGRDVDAVIETCRGHRLGRVIWDGEALPNTGIPGDIAGVSRDRVIYTPSSGVFHAAANIGDVVAQGQIVGYVGDEPISVKIDGLLRGLLRDGLSVRGGIKAGDVDPRYAQLENFMTVSDKARCIAGGVLEALLWDEK